MSSLLLVDDDPGYADMLSQTLNRHGIHVIAAENAERAVDAATSGGIACITTDSFMFDPEQFPSMLKIREILPEAPLFCISGHRGNVASISSLDRERREVSVLDVFIKGEEDYFVPRIKEYFLDSEPTFGEILSRAESDQFRSLVRKKAFALASPEDLENLKKLQEKRIDRIGSIGGRLPERQQSVREKAFERVLEAMTDYAKTIEG